MQFAGTPAATEGIPGWFDWEEYTDRVVASAPPGSILVELGVFLGRSLSYMAKKAKEADKGLTVVGVDTFKGSPEFEGRVWIEDLPPSEWVPGRLVSDAVACLTTDGTIDDVTLIVGDSADTAKLFGDRSVWSVFIDAGHAREDVVRDVAAWTPKVMPGGTIAGHDYWIFPGVKAAVDAIFPGLAVFYEQSWWEATL
jgi:hypothetical protein